MRDRGLVIDLFSDEACRRRSRRTNCTSPGEVACWVIWILLPYPHGLAVPCWNQCHDRHRGTYSGRRTRPPDPVCRRLPIDNLLEATMVLADGSVSASSATEHPDLFWAIRGGGGIFWVVTSFLFRAHPVHTVVWRANVLAYGRR